MREGRLGGLEDIPAASEWERDINDSIDGAESFVFVVSTLARLRVLHDRVPSRPGAGQADRADRLRRADPEAARRACGS